MWPPWTGKYREVQPIWASRTSRTLLCRRRTAAPGGAIVTRNGRDFARAVIPVFSPIELLAAVHADPQQSSAFPATRSA